MHARLGYLTNRVPVCCPELDNKPLGDAKVEVGKWAVFRLTLAKRYSHAECFAAAGKMPQSLPAFLLPEAVVGLFFRTLAVAAYDGEVTCLVRVRGPMPLVSCRLRAR